MIDPQHFVRKVKERDLFPHERNRVVVACSGGPDSLCLLYLLWSCREPLGLELSVLTCDHGLRSESEAEALDVRQRAWMLGLPCAYRKLDVPKHQFSGESVEMAARRLRREAYAEVAEEFEAESVALGHHLDDQAETVLLKLTRGTGSRGAGGMEEVSALTPEVNLVRPLLSFRRKEIEQTLQRWRQTPVMDPSNQSRDFTRNRMRLDVLPLLEEINPGVVRHLADFAEDQRRLEAWASREATEQAKTCVAEEGLNLEPWRFLPDVIRERIVLGWFRDQGGAPETVSRAAWNDLFQELVQPTSHSRKWTLGTIPLQAENDVLTAGQPAPLHSRTLHIEGGEFDLNGRLFRLEQTDHVDPRKAGQQELGGRLTGFVRIPEGELRLRAPLPGDRVQLMGMKGRSKVSDLMINAKVPARLRASWPVITCGDEIVWIPGFRVAESWKVTQTPCLQMSLGPA